MSSFDTLESSVEESRPIELFEFTLGMESFRFTSAEDEVTVGSIVYTPEAIARGTVVQGSDQANRNLSVTMPATNTLSQKFLVVPPGEKTSLSIFRLQRDEPSFATQVLQFKGFVQSVRFPNDGTSAEFAMRSIESALNQNVPRFSFMNMCNHVLYDAACGAIANDFDHVGTATDVTGSTITVSGVSASGFDFVSGYARPVGVNDFRLVLAQSGDVLTLLLPFNETPLDGNVQIFAGCDHLIAGDCATLFDRVADFGGFAFVPNKSIFETGLD